MTFLDDPAQRFDAAAAREKALRHPPRPAVSSVGAALREAGIDPDQFRRRQRGDRSVSPQPQGRRVRQKE